VAIRVQRKRTIKPADERRRDLLAAAVRVFTRKGLHEATVADVTRSAGVAKGTFYLYFESKEQLLGALKERFVDELVERAAALTARVGKEDWWALVDATVESMVDFTLEHRELIEVFAQEGSTPESYQVFAECHDKVSMMFSAGLQAGIEAGAFKVGDPLLAATLLSHALDGTLQHAILYRREVDRDRILAAALELTRKALAP
jgi:AcrR family transcriptional regulator